MPSNATDTASWVANVQRPNNGELADAASLSQGFNPITQRSRWLYERTRGKLFDPTRAPYNANAVGAANAASAINACLSDAHAGGGAVYMGGIFRLDSGLISYPGLHIFGDPIRTLLLMNHATADIFTMSGSGVEPAGIFEDLNFGSLVANTGTVFYNPTGQVASYIVRNCGMNTSSSNLLGRWFNGLADSNWTFDDCTVYAQGTGGTSDVYAQNSGDARLKVRGGKIVLPTTYSSHALYSLGGWTTIDGTEIVTPAASNGRSLLEYSSTTYQQRATNLLLRGGNSTVFAISFSANVQLFSHGHQLDNSADMSLYSAPASGMLAAGSRVELRPHKVQQPGTTTTISADNKGYRTLIILSGATTTPNITLTKGLYDGQRLKLIVRNNGSSWGAGFTITDSLHISGTTTHPTLTLGTSCELNLIWSDMFDPGITWSWVVTDL